MLKYVIQLGAAGVNEKVPSLMVLAWLESTRILKAH